MSVKTITIDVEAYEILARRKRPGQSFSQLVKERFGRIKTGRDLAAALGGVHLSEETLAAVNDQVRRRSRNRARAARL
jgi:predicted CopG family antitoxin